MATAVRDPDGVIQVESERFAPPEKQSKATRIPFVRGVVNFVRSLIDGNRTLMRSADVAMPDDEQPTKAKFFFSQFRRWEVGGVQCFFKLWRQALNRMKANLVDGIDIFCFLMLPVSQAAMLFSFIS